SDNTHRDIYTNALGVQNVYLGRYGNIDGPGLDELLEARDPELNAKLKDQIQTALDDIEEIPTPFDAAITSENGSDARDKIQTAIRDLQDVAETLVEAGKVLGVDVAVL
ncbi:MAG: iron-regulated protein, partial [Myxococcales bacterium]|nr:iron-regulated protein [Myxococcales bacterium]